MFIALMACQKTLDLEADTYYDIKEFLKSKNCETNCGTSAECEGKSVKLQGIYYEDYGSISSAYCQYFVISDRKKNDYSFKYHMQIHVDSSICLNVNQLLQGRDGQLLKVEGIIIGHDEPDMAGCKRGFIMKLQDVNSIKF